MFFYVFSVRQRVSFLNKEKNVCFLNNFMLLLHFLCHLRIEMSIKEGELTKWLVCSCSVKERTSVSTGLVGCVRMLDVNNFAYNLQENGGSVLYGSAIGECGNNPCLPNPCKNGASCQVKEAEMFHCKCVNGFSGGCTSINFYLCVYDLIFFCATLMMKYVSFKHFDWLSKFCFKK